MRLLVSLLAWFLRAVFTSRGSLALENLALREQLATYARGRTRPLPKPEERACWVALSTLLSLFVVPALFSLVWKARARLHRTAEPPVVARLPATG